MNDVIRRPQDITPIAAAHPWQRWLYTALLLLGSALAAPSSAEPFGSGLETGAIRTARRTSVFDDDVLKPGDNCLVKVMGVSDKGRLQVSRRAALGGPFDALNVDGLFVDRTAREKFFLHYNFPPYSVGETRPIRTPGRREIGHGTL